MYLNAFKLLLETTDRIEINGKYITFVSSDNEDIFEVKLYKLLENWYIIDIELSKIMRQLNNAKHKKAIKFKKDIYNYFCNCIGNIEYVEEICYFRLILLVTEDNIKIIEMLIKQIDILKNSINEYIKNKRVEMMI